MGMRIAAVGTMNPTDEQVFNDLLAPLVQPAYRLACGMLHDAQTAEDVVQEASLIAWRKLGGLRDHERIRPWFLGVVANECRNVRRRRWATGVTVGLPKDLSVASGEERSVRGADLRKALQHLKYDDRLVVVLYFYVDLPLSEIASTTGMSLSNVRARLYRAVHRLRPDLAIEEAIT